MLLRTYRDYIGYLDDEFDEVVSDSVRYLRGPEDSGLQYFEEARAWGIHYNFQEVIEQRLDVHGVLAFAQSVAADVGIPESWVGSLQHKNQHGNGIIQLRDNADGRGLTQGEIPPAVLRAPGVTFLSPEAKLTPQQYMKIIQGAEWFAGPDSSGLQVAAFSGVKKIVGLYTKAFPPEIRSYPGVEAFTELKGFQDALCRIVGETNDSRA
jgi:hypothetical protein